MKVPNSLRETPSHILIDPDTGTTDRVLILNVEAGQRNVEVFNLEKGLQARLWDFCLTDGSELCNHIGSNIENPYYTLAYFWVTEGKPLIKASSSDNDYVLLDRVFLHALCDYKVYIPGMIKGYCFSISFSKNWLCSMLKGNKVLERVKQKICKADAICLAEIMTQSERNLLEELVGISWQKQLGSFYIKSTVLKIVSNFLYSLKSHSNFHSNHNLTATVAQVEQYIIQDVTGVFPPLNDLARKFSLSLSTLNRKFKTRYGTTMTDYFYSHKMRYAKQLIQEKGLSIGQAALMVGYQRTQNFIKMFKKYYDLSIPAMCV